MGHHNIQFHGDEHADSGVWSPPTSKANFCEEDYAVTRYLAEFVNALTNLAYVYFALRYMYGGRTSTSRLGGLVPARWDFMSLSLLILGIGSFLYHATLRQTMQFVDDLSMIGLAWSILQSVWAVRQSPAKVQLINVVLAVSVCSFSAFYVWTGQISHHYIGFMTMLGILALRCRYILHWMQPGLSEEKRRREWDRRTWRSTFWTVLGYIIWNVDLEFCKELRMLRERVGLPWGWVLELHGWWHVLTAVGTSQFMDIAREIREEVRREKMK